MYDVLGSLVRRADCLRTERHRAGLFLPFVSAYLAENTTRPDRTV